MPNNPKPCPFVHPIKAGVTIEPVNSHFHGVCGDCGANGPQQATYAEALDAWNARRPVREQRH